MEKALSKKYFFFKILYNNDKIMQTEVSNSLSYWETLYPLKK